MKLKKLGFGIAMLCSAAYAIKSSHVIDRFQDDETLNAFIQSLEEKTSRFTSDKFLTSLEEKQRSFKQRKNAWNEKPLYTLSNPFNNSFSVGVYVDDLFKMGFVGLDVAYDWYFYNALKMYTIEKIRKILISYEQPHNLDPETHKEHLCNALHTALKPSFQEFKNPEFVMLITKITLAQIFLSCAKETVLSNNQGSASWVELLTRTLANHPARRSKPIPIFEVIDEHVLTQFAMNNSKGGIIESINHIFDSFGLVPSLIKHGIVRHIEMIATNILFISWFNSYMIAPMMDAWIQANFEYLESLRYQPLSSDKHLYTGGCRLTQTDDRLKNFEKKSEEIIKKSIDKALSLSLGTWLSIKNTTLARWKLYRNVLVSLPGWYRLLNGAYGMYKKIMI